jgi:hypothetical protein
MPFFGTLALAGRTLVFASGRGVRRGAKMSKRRDRGQRWHGTIGKQATLGVALVALLALAACGGTTRTGALRPRAGSGPVASATTSGGQTNGTPVPYPTTVPPPYAFPKTWQVPASGAPTQVTPYQGWVFAPSSPRVGYACNTVQTAGQASASSFYATHDGGQTWQALGQPQIPTGSTPAGEVSVFVDTANAQDVFVKQDVSYPESGASVPTVWRSLDGGATWHQLASVPILPQGPSTVNGLGVLGTRIVVAMSIQGEGTLDNDLYASDDGGATWHQFAVSLPSRVLGFVILGNSVIVQTIPPAVAAADRRPTARSGPSLTRPGSLLSAPGSSGGPPPVYFRSDDGGNTWAKVSVPGGMPVFTLAAAGTAYFGVSVAEPQSPGAPVVAYWSQDSGATWKALPTLQGVEGGWLDPTSLGLNLVVAPDGTVLTDTRHPTNPPAYQSDAGLFVLNAASATAVWQPLAPSADNQMQAVRTASGVRVWTVQASSGGFAGTPGTPVYLDLP